MDVQPLNSNMLGHLATAYSQAVAGIPHCYPVNRDDLEYELASVLSGEATETRRDEAVFVAIDERKLVGFAHAAVGPPKPGKDPDEGLVRFLWYRPGNRVAGAALLKAAEEHCASRGMMAVNVFPQKHRYSFYMMKSAYMSDRLGHVAALLGMHGYQRNEGEVYMDWPDYTMPEPGPLPDALQVEVEHTGGRGRLPGVSVRVVPDGKQIAVCQNVSAGEFSRDRQAQEWTFTNWIGVDADYQGLGLGRWLLRRALFEAQRIGYRHAAISTAWDNYRALMFYTNFGYQVANWTYGYRRELT